MKTLNIGVSCLLVVLLALVVIGVLNFGYGLGNYFYVLPLIGFTTLQIFVTRRLLKLQVNQYWSSIFIITLVVCSLILLKTTIYRGPEFSWNGEVFFIK